MPDTSEFDLEAFITDRLIHDLNNTNIFDFDYTPKVGDKICFVADELKPEYVEEHEIAPLKLFLMENSSITWGLVQILKVGKSFYVGKSVLCSSAVSANW